MHSRILAKLSVVLGLTIVAWSATAGTFKHITIDGSFTDWAGVPVAYTDPSEDGASAGTDFKDVWIAHDAEYIYVRVSLYNTGSLLRSQNNVFINADGDTATGFNIHGTGSELLVQGGTGYQERDGAFNDGFTIQNLGWAVAPTDNASEFEFRVSRQAKYDNGNPVFTSETIGVLLETENNNFSEVDIAKDDGPIEYTMEAAPAAAHGNFPLLDLATTSWRFNRAGADLGSAWKEISFDDSQSGWESGKGLFGKAVNASVYPFAINTSIPETSATHYFRAKFNWDKDTAGLSLVASNILASGAIIYLNGTEMTRVRLSSTNVSFSTPASANNPQLGSVEVIDLPANALVVGSNVLAVEVHPAVETSADNIFGLALFASDQLPVSIVSMTGGQDLIFDEGIRAELKVTVRGTEPITYQWFHGGAAIPDATNSVYAINSVSPTDAGEYSVKVSNAYAQNVTSATVVLQTRAVPVKITNPNLPADLAVTEGEPAHFALEVSGSAPISYQWFKEGVFLANATNATLDIPSALGSDAGQYTVAVSNRVTALLTSRTAKLTINPDKIAPQLVSVSGGGKQMRVQFSEPVSSNTLALANFSINPTVPVTGATLNPADETEVVLQTGGLTLGTLYSVSVSQVTDRFGNSVAGGSRKSFRATITIDGSFDDWEGVSVAYSDPEDAGLDTGAHADFKDVWITSDNDYIYLRFTLWRADDPFVFYNNIFVDSDNDPATGYSFNGLGSDMLIQSGAAYEEKVASFNDGGVDQLDWLSAPAAPGTEFEMRFSRQARYVDADAGGLVFKAESIALVLESENSGFATKDMAPDSGAPALVHKLLNYAATELKALSVSVSSGQLKIEWSGAGKLQATDTLRNANWQDVSNATSPYSAAVSGQQRYFRLISP